MENTTRSQLRLSSEIFNISRRTKPVSPDYIVGLTDGEGCFYVLLTSRYNKNGGTTVQLNFFIKVRQEDKMMLDEVKEVLGCGAVYFQKEARKNHTQCYRYSVTSHRDIMSVIIPFFKKYPLHSASKQRSFFMFCEIARMVENGAHHNKEGLKVIKNLKEKTTPVGVVFEGQVFSKALFEESNVGQQENNHR